MLNGDRKIEKPEESGKNGFLTGYTGLISVPVGLLAYWIKSAKRKNSTSKVK